MFKKKPFPLETSESYTIKRTDDENMIQELCDFFSMKKRERKDSKLKTTDNKEDLRRQVGCACKCNKNSVCSLPHASARVGVDKKASLNIAGSLLPHISGVTRSASVSNAKRPSASPASFPYQRLNVIEVVANNRH